MSYRTSKAAPRKKNFFSHLLPAWQRIFQAAGGPAAGARASIINSEKSRSSLIFLHKFIDQLELKQPRKMLIAAARQIRELNEEQTLVLISAGKNGNEMIIAGQTPTPVLNFEIAGLRARFNRQNSELKTTDATAPTATVRPQNRLRLIAATTADGDLDQLLLYSNGLPEADRCELLDYCLTHLGKRLREARNWHKLQQDNRIDSLTSLYNRRCFDEIILKEIERSERYNHPTSLIMLDIDHFKAINDNYGHRTGDSVLKNLGKILRDEVRQSDTPCRYGGEEFTIILPQTRLDEARRMAERIRKAIARRDLFTVDKVKFNVTASIGVAGTELNSALDLVECADQALYRAKNNGRNQTVTASPTVVRLTPITSPIKKLENPALSRCFQNLSMIKGDC